EKDVGLLQLSHHLLGIGHEVWADIAAVELHAFDDIELVNAPGFVFSVGLPPGNAAAALAAVGVMAAGPERVTELHQRGGLFLELARQRGLPTGCSKGISIVPLIVDDTKRCVALTNALFARGIDVQPILYPGVKERAVRLRFFINRIHSEEQFRRAIAIINEEWRQVSGDRACPRRSTGAADSERSLDLPIEQRSGQWPI
ncbi:MAG TPA: hypothetical protein VE396_19045, partial [Xanthobacteraceae bacterium]|nr:hypothetical protein [Xanthobacteraceae bacterium]